MMRFTMLRSALLIMLAAGAVALIAGPAGAQSAPGAGIAAYLSVPRGDGSAEEGRPFLHPHFYQQGADGLEFEIAIRRDYDYGRVYRTPAEQHRGGNCPWWDAKKACGEVTFADDWTHVQVMAYLADAMGAYATAFGASTGIGPKTGSFCETTGMTAIPGSVCVISKADWKAAQGATADGDAAAPLRLTLTTGAAETRNIQVEAAVWSARDAAIAGAGHQIHLQYDRGAVPELFFYKVEQHHYLPCTAAEMAAEDMGACDPVVDDGEIVNIGLTITNGESGANGIDHAVTGHVPRRDHQRRFLDFDRVVFEWDGGGSILGIRPLTNCHPHGTLAMGGECTLTSDGWFASYPIGSYGIAFAHDDSVGHISVSFAVLPTSTPTDHTITAKLYREPVPGDGAVTETPATATITIEDATAASRPTIYSIEDKAGNEVDLLIGSARHFDWLVFGYDIETEFAGPALFGELAASGAALTVEADRGAFRMWGRECAASGGGCSLSFTREQMKRGYSSNRPQGAEPIPAGAAGDAHRIPWRARLYYFAPFDDEGPAKITATVRDAGGIARGAEHLHPFRDTSAPLLEVRTPEDADGILEPGQTTAVQVGFSFSTSGTPTAAPELGTDLSVECPDDHETHFCELVEESRLDPEDSWFVLTGDAHWEPDGEARLDASAGDFRCERDEEAGSAGRTAYFCAYGIGAGSEEEPRIYPRLTVDYGATGEVGLRANLKGLDGRQILIDDRYNSEVHRRWHRGQAEYFTSSSIRVGTVLQVASASLGRENREVGPIRVGREGKIELAVLNQNGIASQADAISSITITTTNGGLYGPHCRGGTERGEASKACSIDVSGSLAEAARADPRLVGRIPVLFTAPAEAGSAIVRASVVARVYGAPIEINPLNISFTGDARALSLSAEVPRVHHADTEDDRDTIEFAASAVDSEGRATELPHAAGTEITGPDGERVQAGFIIVTTCRTEEETVDRSRCRFKVDVEAAAADPLPTGLYSFTARLGTTAIARSDFGVAGDPASLSPEFEEAPAVGREFSAEVAVADADGQPVADGSEVRIEVRGRIADVAPGILLISPRDGVARTLNGRATARFLVVSREVSAVTFRAGRADGAPEVTATSVVDTRDGAGIAAGDSSRWLRAAGGGPIGGFATWIAPAGISASALVADLPGATGVLVWNGTRWLQFSSVEGAPAGASADFTIQPGDTLWIVQPSGDGGESDDDGNGDGEAQG